MDAPRDASDSLAGSLAGDRAARGQLLERLYDDLRALAGARLGRERADHTLQPTALVHEAFLRLVDQDRCDVEGRTHFLALASTTMRRVLVDHARAKHAQKRGGRARPETLDDAHAIQWDDPTEVLALDEALGKLGEAHERQARVAELRLFGGLGLQETGQALGVSRDTVKLDWRFARAFLNRVLTGDGQA